ncbi:MAG: hypothetical protein ACK4YP_00125 [Myxococcota bacterium]
MTALLLLLSACTGSPADDTGAADTAGTADTADTADTAPPPPGSLALTFRIDDDLIPEMAEAGEAPIGTFSGAIFREQDGTDLGPVDGAVPLAEFGVTVDLTPDGGPTAALYTSDPIEPQIVWVLGCLDSDANGECGDAGDPITVPSENKFRVEPETTTTVEVYMGMLRP